MKTSKLLFFLVPALLFMTSCQSQNSQQPQSNTSDGSQPSDTSSNTDQSSEATDTLIADLLSLSGVATGFPANIVESFADFYDLEISIPSLGDETIEWDYYASDYDGSAYLNLIADDNDELIGTNSFEDQMKAALEDSGITVSDDNYDDVGYEAVLQDGLTTVSFYTYFDMFSFYINGPVVFSQSTSFPSERFAQFLNFYGFPSDTPTPSSSNEWNYAVTTDGENYTFEAYCADDGTIGTDSTEDAYKATLLEAGFEIDDSEYDNEGYFATKDDLFVQFFSYDGEFDIWFSNANSITE